MVTGVALQARTSRSSVVASDGGTSIQEALLAFFDRESPVSPPAAATRLNGISPLLWERPSQAAMGLVFAALAILQTWPFFFVMSEGAAPIWQTLFGLTEGMGPAVMLGAATMLAAVIGAKAHGKKSAFCSFRLIFWMVHVVNVTPLVYCVPWWWKGSFAESEVGDLMEGFAYISGVMCQWNMGLCLLPLARESAWLNSASVAYPEGIPFHRLTGWWCIAQVVIHSIAELVAVVFENYEEYSPSERRPEYATASSEWNTTRLQGAFNSVAVFVFPWVERLDDETGEPELNTEGLRNFFGVLGVTCAVTLGSWAAPAIRRRAYDWFYKVHVPMATGFIVCGTPAHALRALVHTAPPETERALWDRGVALRPDSVFHHSR